MNDAVLFKKKGCKVCDELLQCIETDYNSIYQIDVEDDYMGDIEAWMLLSYNNIDPTSIKVPVLFVDGVLINLDDECKEGVCKR